MLAGRAHARADHRADDERAASLATKHVAQLGPLVKDLIPADTEEVYKHQLGYRAHTCGRSADRRADEPGFSDGGIQDAITPKLLDKALGDAEYAAPGFVILQVIDSCSARDILTH